MANSNTNIVRSARRGLDNTSSLILHEIYLAYPKEVSLKTIGEKLHIVEKTIQSSIRRINNYGVPIEYKNNKNEEKTLRANIKEPISWILKEKSAAENMLSLLKILMIMIRKLSKFKRLLIKGFILNTSTH